MYFRGPNLPCCPFLVNTSIFMPDGFGLLFVNSGFAFWFAGFSSFALLQSGEASLRLALRATPKGWRDDCNKNALFVLKRFCS